MPFYLSKVLFLVLSGLACTATTNAEVAMQVGGDGTIGTRVNGLPTTACTTSPCAVTAGTQIGQNLFHSFDTFNVGTKGIVDFQGPDRVANVISRVTGRLSGLKPSGIDGTIKSNSANLFLINPAGMVFGSNASLDVSGSFHVSTADYIRLQDGARFNAVPGPQDEFLTAAPVAAFGFLKTTPAEIKVTGAPENNAFLAMREGHTITLAAEEVRMENALIAAPSGQIQLASASSGKEIPVGSRGSEGGSLDLGGRIDLNNSALITPGSGQVAIRGGRLVLKNSLVEAATVGENTSRGVDIRGESLTMDSSRISTSDVQEPGRGGEVKIQTVNDIELNNSKLTTSATDATGQITMSSRCLLLENADIIAETTKGVGQRIDVDVDSLELVGSDINTSTAGAGAAGNINIRTNDLTIKQGDDGTQGLIRSITRASGSGGDIFIKSDKSLDILLEDRFSLVVAQSVKGSSGSAGNLRIEAKEDVYIDSDESSGFSVSGGGEGERGALSIISNLGSVTLDGGVYETNAVGPEKPGGSINVSARDSVVIKNEARVEAETIPSSGADTILSTAKGGDIFISTDGTITLQNAARISASTRVVGDGGKISLIAGDSVVVEDSLITTSADPSDDLSAAFKSNAGNITVRAQDSVILRGGFVESTAKGFGEKVGGNLTIQANALKLLPGKGIEKRIPGAFILGPTDFSAIDTSTNGAGNAGTITLNIDSLELVGSDINTSTAGAGAAGNINIRTNDLTIKQGDDGTQGLIRSITRASGSGGDIFIKSDKSLDILLEDRFSLVVAQSVKGSSGSAGNLRIEAKEDVYIDSDESSGFSVSGGGEGERGALSIISNLGSVTLDGGVYETNAVGPEKPGGSINVSARDSVVIKNEARVEAETIPSSGADTILSTAKGGDIFISTDGTITLQNAARISASTRVVGDGGKISLIAGDSVVVEDSLITTSADPSDDLSAAFKSNAGNITVRAQDSVILRGGFVESTAKGFGEKVGGNLTIQANALKLLPGKGIEKRIPGAFILGPTDFSAIDTSTNGAGNAGTITLNIDSLVMNGARVSSRSSGTGDAGSVSIRGLNGTESTAATVELVNSTFSTDARKADGGNINLKVGRMVDLIDSAITTSVSTGQGRGGNITIDPRFVILDSSRIQANAFGGPGGKLRIVTDAFIRTPDSIIEASSQQSIDGEVIITAPDTDLSRILTPLAVEFEDPGSRLGTSCIQRLGIGQSSFGEAGRYGIPPAPQGFMPAPKMTATEMSGVAVSPQQGGRGGAASFVTGGACP